MDLSQITPLILTFNEKENIGRTVNALTWAREVAIVDSGSTDGTTEIARRRHPNVRILSRNFDNHTAQWNFGLDQVATQWVLSLDADYLVSPDLITEIASLQPGDNVSAYSAEFKYRIRGIPLRTSVYPPRTVLFRRDASRYYDDGHTQLVKTDGLVLPFKNKIDHDDRKPFGRWFKEQKRYAKIEARYLLSQPFKQLNLQDRLRRMIIVAAPAISLYLLFVLGLILDGWRGWYYVFQRTVAELLLSVALVTEHFRNRS